jgi:WD40 repeat protein
VKDPFALAFSPDGRLLAVGNAEDFTAAIWDLSSWLNAGSPTGAVLKDPSLILQHYGGSGGFKGIQFSPDGRWVGTVFQNMAILWDALSGKELRTFTGHTAFVFDISFSPDGSRLATAGWDCSARVWDISTGRELLRLTGHDGGIGGPAYSSDGSRLATFGHDGKVILWDPHNGRKLFELPGRGGVHDLVFSPDGLRLVSTHEDRYGRVWDASLLGRGELRVARNQVNISGVICSPDRSCIASIEGRVVRILHAATLQEMQVLENFKVISSDPDPIDGLAFSADHAMLAVAQGKNGVTIWNLVNGQLLCQLPFPDSASAVAFSPTGRWLAVSGSYTRVVIYEGNENHTWREVERLDVPLTVQRSVRFGLAFSPDSRWLAAGGSDERGEIGGHIFIWQVNNPKEETRPIHIGEADARSINALTFSPNSQVLASCGAEGSARLWDAATGKQLRQLTGHNATVTDIHFSPDGKYLVTASLDRTARVWDATDGKELLRYQLPDSVLGAYFTPDGQGVVVVPQTGGYHLNAFMNIDELVAVARARLTRDWQPEEIQKYLYGKKYSPV